jgi:hypothetical protein
MTHGGGRNHDAQFVNAANALDAKLADKVAARREGALLAKAAFLRVAKIAEVIALAAI